MKDVTWTDYTAQIQDYSLSQGEPEWLLNRRIQALEKIETLALPMIERVKIHRWPLTEVTTMIDDTVSGAVYDFEQVENNPLIVQHSTQTLVEQMPAHLIEKGVILTDIQTAVQEHSDLVEKALMQQAVHYDEDKLTAFHMAFMNSGIFLYIPKNVAIEEPVEALFYQDSHANTNFVKHVLIVAEENSEVSYLERFQTVGEGTEKATANIVVEVIAKQGAKVKFAAIDQLGEHVTTYINRRANVGRDASVDWAIGIMNDGNVVADFDSDLVGEGSHSEVKAVAISAGRQTQGIDTRVTNSGRHSVGHILQHGVIRERGTLTFNGIGHILKGAVGADAQQESRVLMLSDQARGDANPILLIDENEVTAGHAASVGRVDPEEMYYLMSRGLEKTEAERLVIRGFLGSVLTAIPIKAVRDELAEVIERKLS
ncbi:Fe-S cluster assembly protein SufD [Vagococcus lutrae]|uniref:FeS assembly protein SufD n=1 Tax=Vagococcus lutrae LBD1 TaxID=1408226 RepID=V6Q6F2_9ENTE|nr:Fe-S cluster assembly protein SufD [Vagococcus lutrae]EST90235.1 FeS assembly protein SufD [Vagococcus lutrae LBD1]MCO7150238.1 Fe-S cluster assembly protein SufD [Vagococcus lutrae]MDT2801272.1 Fe-S cluster assembly protein SufD [Vagococcus lutrae]MDT2818343.1 Fe-S cluster assembly protein SufD [Vagococcus lutrae]MDT2841419.1 Fe-S cluster assembly protein SufD [Vagococcus lutrae]